MCVVFTNTWSQNLTSLDMYACFNPNISGFGIIAAVTSQSCQGTTVIECAVKRFNPHVDI